jgi:hypothetical protein
MLHFICGHFNCDDGDGLKGGRCLRRAALVSSKALLAEANAETSSRVIA